jgi:hypothetical protein
MICHMHDATWMLRSQGGQSGRRPCHTPCVTGTGPESELRAATTRRKRTEDRLRDARAAEARAILAALDAGMKQVDVVGITGYTREHVRRLADSARKQVQ